MEIYKKGIIFVISAPSGAGKTTLCDRLLKSLPDLRMSVSYTTRKPRDGEKHGVDYYFVDKKTFETMISNEEFVEWAEVYGNLYGTSKRVINDFLSKECDILLDIDIQGAKNIKKIYPESVLVFILPPSLKELEKRLLSRDKNDEFVKKRLSKASEEIKQFPFYDYVVINDDIEKAVNDLCCIIYAERLKASRIKEESIKKFFKEEEIWKKRNEI